LTAWGRVSEYRDVRDVKLAGPDRVPPISEMLARSFANDPMFASFVVAGTQPDSGLSRFFGLLELPLAELGFLWEIGDAVAAAGWIPPGSDDVLLRIDAATLPLARELSNDDGRSWTALWDWVEERIPPEPHWYLDNIGVDSSAQGQGLGRALIEHGLALAAADDTYAVLETTVASNVSYYEHLGFVTIEHGDPPFGAPHVWLMRHDP
jgi:ribosomal protein S18 acetylase RimI-like enzyme